MKALLLSVLSAGLLASCSSVTVDTDYDKTVDFSKYRSFSLASPKSGESLSPSSENALRGALRTGLAAKGLQEKSGSSADLSIVRHAFSKDKVSVTQYSDWGYGYGPRGAWPYGYGRYDMWYGAPVTYTDVQQSRWR